ncbi:hypothetical protein Rsub_03915 [Raphidocelis subcapitata]|uniref:RAP domain-containing protein n=1 Tax=Raphidocelis subcapitata TaxID=307507 RepID=A0A2V0NUP7_9CHLO|nr:hypothetical protein Rsub_03915 [Raphidocelis subcapitata]|eukprot:GBF91059.1 hypothetical protein Rsub_03915 [Raphidocelis subcapitata]
MRPPRAAAQASARPASNSAPAYLARPRASRKGPVPVFAAYSGRSSGARLGGSQDGPDRAAGHNGGGGGGSGGAGPSDRAAGGWVVSSAAAAVSAPVAPPTALDSAGAALLEAVASVRVRVPALPPLGRAAARGGGGGGGGGGAHDLEGDHPGPAAVAAAGPAAADGAWPAPPAAVPAAPAAGHPLAALTARADAWAAAGERPGDEAWAALEREARPLLRGAPADAVVALLDAAARAGRRPSAPWLAAAQAEIAAAAARAPLSVDDWAAALSAAARCGPVERGCAAAAFSDTTPALAAAPPDGAARLLWGVAKARAAPPPAWLEALRGALPALAPGMSAPQLACALRSLAVMSERTEGEELRPAAAALAEALAARGPASGAGPGELAQAVWALARLGCRGAAHVSAAAALLAPIQQQLPRLTAGQLGCLLWALAKMEAPVPPSTAAELALEFAAQMRAMSNREWVQSAWALAKLGARLSPASADAFWQQAHLRTLAPGESTLVLWAVARLGLDPPPRWLAAQLARVEGSLPGLRPDQHAATLVALARMGRAPPRGWVAAFEAATRLEEFKLQELVNMLWAFNALRHAPSLPWQHACVTALRAACADACGQSAPLGADAVAGLLEEAGLLPVLSEAVAAQSASEASGDEGDDDGEGSCPLSFAFELPLGAA